MTTNFAPVAPVAPLKDWRALLAAADRRERSGLIQAALAEAAKAEVEAQKAKAKTAKAKAVANAPVPSGPSKAQVWAERLQARARKQALSDLLAAHPWLRDTLWFKEGAQMEDPVVKPGVGNPALKGLDAEKASARAVFAALEDAVPVWAGNRAAARAVALEAQKAKKVKLDLKAAIKAEREAEQQRKKAHKLAQDAVKLAHKLADEERKKAERAEERRKAEEAMTLKQALAHFKKAAEAARAALAEVQALKKKVKEAKEATGEVKKELLGLLRTTKAMAVRAAAALTSAQALVGRKEPLSIVEMVAQINRRSLCLA